jgi:hypothetical protein
MILSNIYETILALHKAGHRQKHACTCGPSSLALVTQALGLDPKPESAWLAPEFAKWLPLEQLTTTRGMALHEAFFTTEVVYPKELDIQLKRAYPENLPALLRDLESAEQREDTAIILNFAQDHVLGQPFQGQGSPHFSPVGGYDAAAGRILIADVDYEITAPYWCSVDRAFEAMAFINPAFQTPRGWLVVRRRQRP